MLPNFQDKLRLLALTHQIENANIKPQFTFSPHKKMILDARIPEGCSDLLLTLGLDNSVKVMDLESGEQVGELFLEDTPSCFCTDYLGQIVFVGFADGRIRKYRYKKKSYDIGLLVDPDNTENITAGLEKQEEKALLQVSHKSKVTSMVYVPELKEVISSGTDDMLFMFTSEGVTTYTTGKYKKNFDFMNLVQRPKALYSSTNFGATLTKTKMFFKPLQK
jgi:WD40 repeat protein